MEKPVEEQLLHMLRELDEEDLRYFQWILQNVPVASFQARKKIRLEKADIMGTVELMFHTYASKDAVRVTRIIMKKIKKNKGQ